MFSLSARTTSRLVAAIRMREPICRSSRNFSRTTFAAVPTATTRSVVAAAAVPGHPLFFTAATRGFSSSNNSQQNQQSPKDELVGMSTDAEENRQVYDKWAAQYEKDITEWGYDLPDRVATLVAQKLKSLKDPDFVTPHIRTILDAGAGDGLVGVALRKHLSGDSSSEQPSLAQKEAYIVGSDISREMLRVAKARGCYDVVVQMDLNSTPFCNNTLSNAILNACNSQNSINIFDCITCVGTMTYVDPSAGTLREFCRWAKPGGYICYTNRTDKLEAFRPYEEQLEQEGLWSLVEKVGPIPYLPDHPDFADKIEVVIFLYQKAKE